MPEYQVKSPLQHDGKRYEIGGAVTMEEEQARPLVDIGVLGEPTGAQTGGKNPPPPPDPDRQQKIIEAIGQLEKQNQELWTKDGKPQVPAIEEILGDNITAAERNDAWEQINKD